MHNYVKYFEFDHYLLLIIYHYFEFDHYLLFGYIYTFSRATGNQGLNLKIYKNSL